MNHFRTKQAVVTAITFDQLVQHGRDHGANIVNGMPWSFQYRGHAVTHSDDRHYLVCMGAETLHVTPADMLVTDAHGELSVHTCDAFNATYESV